MLLCLLGGMFGLCIAVALEHQIAIAIKGILPTFSISAGTLIMGALLAAGLGIAVGLVPALRARRLAIVDERAPRRGRKACGGMDGEAESYNFV